MAAEVEEPIVYLYDALAPLGNAFEDESSFSIATDNGPPAGIQTVTSASTLANGALHPSVLSPLPAIAVDDRSRKESNLEAASTSSSDERKHGVPSDAGKESDSEALVSEIVVETVQLEVIEASLPGGVKVEDEDFLSLDVNDLGNASIAEQARVTGETLMMSADTTSVAKEAPPWARSAGSYRTRFRSPFLQLHQEIVNFCNFVTPTEEEKLVRETAVQRVSEVVKSIWPSCQVKVFGSFATGLFLPTSDCDVVILDSGCQVPRDGLKAIAKALNRKSLVKNLQIIGKARVPIVKFVETQSKIAFDISFDVANGPDAADFIKDVMDSLPPLKPLCLVLKIFLQQRELNEVYTGGIGSYALLVMLMAHLQMHPSRRNVNSWGDPSPLESNLGILLVDFFDFYGRTLNVRDVGISCRSGGRFYAKESRGFLDPGRPFLLSVEDPQSPDNDIGRNSYNVAKVRSAFLLAHRLLTKLEFDDLPANVGLLGRIVRMDEELKNRKTAPPELLRTPDTTGRLSSRSLSGGNSLSTIRREHDTIVVGTSIGSRWLDYEDEDFQRGVGAGTRQVHSRERSYAKDREDGAHRDGNYRDFRHLHKRKSYELENGGLSSGRAKRSRHGNDFAVNTGSPFFAAQYREEGEIGNLGSSSAGTSTEKLSRKSYEEENVAEKILNRRKDGWRRRHRSLMEDTQEDGEIILKDDLASADVSIGFQSGEELGAGAGNGYKSRRWVDGRARKPARMRLGQRAWSPDAGGDIAGRFDDERTPKPSRRRHAQRSWIPDAGGDSAERPRKVVKTKVGHKKITYS